MVDGKEIKVLVVDEPMWYDEEGSVSEAVFSRLGGMPLEFERVPVISGCKTMVVMTVAKVIEDIKVASALIGLSDDEREQLFNIFKECAKYTRQSMGQLASAFRQVAEEQYKPIEISAKDFFTRMNNFVESESSTTGTSPASSHSTVSKSWPGDQQQLFDAKREKYRRRKDNRNIK